ncbi:hypothetical protein FG002_009440 [Chitinimonas sp. BJB300]|nr:hypothetical protein FG002_009440 [Chitinimonas sp. BJB300]
MRPLSLSVIGTEMASNLAVSPIFIMPAQQHLALASRRRLAAYACQLSLFLYRREIIQGPEADSFG